MPQIITAQHRCAMHRQFGKRIQMLQFFQRLMRLVIGVKHHGDIAVHADTSWVQ
jgi:hypothetical protein